jgi:hypothetical protein
MRIENYLISFLKARKNARTDIPTAALENRYWLRSCDVKTGISDGPWSADGQMSHENEIP